jgi:hypothetical protein
MVPQYAPSVTARGIDSFVQEPIKAEEAVKS